MKPRLPPGGFTLLELLVATGITLLLAGLLLTITRHVLDLGQRTRGGLEAAAQADVILDHLERDLQGAIHRRDGGRWLAVDIINQPSTLTGHGWLVGGGMKPGDDTSLRLPVDGPSDSLADARFGLSGCWLRFVGSNVEGGAEASAPVVIAWQLARRPVTGAVNAANPAEIRYRLYRAAVAATVTFNTGYDVRAAAYTTASPVPAAERSALAVTSPGSPEALADNVVDFGVRLLVRQPDGSLRRTFPDGPGRLAHTAPQDDIFPDTIDVMVRILTAAGAARIELIESGRVMRPPEFTGDAAWWWSEVETNSRVFVRRIVLKGGPA